MALRATKDNEIRPCTTALLWVGASGPPIPDAGRVAFIRANPLYAQS